MTTEYKPVLTEDGSAIQMSEGGWPMVLTPKSAEPVAWDIHKQASALAQANAEAKERRLALEGLAKAFGLADLDISNVDNLKSLVDRASAVPSDTEELKRLRDMEAAGQIGEDAQQELIEAGIKKRAGEKIAALEADLAKLRKRAAEEETARHRTQAEYTAAMTRRGLEAFYEKAMRDKSGKMPAFAAGTRSAFVRAALEGDNGAYPVWNERFDANGDPCVVFREADGSVRKGADNIDPLGLGQFSKERLMQSDPYLFEAGDGQTGVGQFGAPPKKNFGDMSPDEIKAAAYEQASA